MIFVFVLAHDPRFGVEAPAGRTTRRSPPASRTRPRQGACRGSRPQCLWSRWTAAITRIKFDPFMVHLVRVVDTSKTSTASRPAWRARPGPERVERLAEAVQIAKWTFSGASFDFGRKHYKVVVAGDGGHRPPTSPSDHDQRGRTPSGGVRSTEADIVCIVPAALPGDGMKPADISMRAMGKR